MIGGLITALQFLTRLPLPVQVPWNAETRRWAIRFYPFAGLLIGTSAFVFLLPVPPAAQALLYVTLLVVWSGGLHLDGWMDTADAAGSNAPLEKKWEIMKDPRVGSFAVIALVFLLAWKTAAAAGIAAADASFWLLLLFVPALARAGAAALLVIVPPAKPDGLAASWQENAGNIDAFWGMLFLLPLFWIPGGLLLAGAAVIFYSIWGWWIRRAFGGISGDLAGASVEGGEAWLLIVLWCFMSAGMV
ncbi:adenosylcobinamide-GDP ribazoletransferase [Alkalicoccus urumqiensis]|uniref:Adenosylcobinamide-GDP ribazoletransferase n=1 Tax=Alkalicoccus urumqiensis TaxID=1548213 RepID=A0A2P6MIA9_ALKUR|nr:adenosylcobinamide-GDP ribazoletransferase [Alkalicoccus urumqiensis]PRO65998.1 adenosylcobinamide-GDP ribazoletransferase [Alkalicoccus urumqiensis]